MTPFTKTWRARFDAALEALASRRAAVWTVAVATVLAATSVGTHRALDDYVLALIARGEGAALGLPRHPLDLFTFTTGVPAENRVLMDAGLMLPWWTDPELHISFLRPVSAVTHFLDEILWPGKPALLHLHSLAWFAAMLAAASFFYRRLEAPRLAGLSFLVYALDDAHGSALSWIANRNALIATCLGCSALCLHDAWRRERRSVLGAAAASTFFLGLLAGELAVGTVAYVVAYAVCRESGPVAERARSLAPYAAVVVVWRLVWTLSGFGAHGSGAYIDPLRHPLDFLTVVPARVLVLLQGQFAGPPADTAFLGPPSHAPFIVALAFATALLVAWLLVPILRRDSAARFWGLGMLLAVLPLSATFPSDRLLFFVGLGGSALVARVVDTWARALAGGTRGKARPAVATLFAILHLAVAPVLLAARSAQMEIFGIAHDRAAASLPSGPSSLAKSVVIVAAPTLLFANYVPAQRRVLGEDYASYQYVLASASSRVRVARTGPRQLTLLPEHGFLYTPLERHYRGAAPLAVGQEVTLSALRARIEAVKDGRPSAVSFEFTAPMGSYLFVTWKDGEYVPFEIPKAGEARELPAEDFGQILARTVERALGAGG